MSGTTRRVVGEVRGVVSHTGTLLGARDLAGAAAALSYYAAIAVVPWLLLATWTTSWGGDPDDAERRLLSLRVLVPPDMGARPAYDALVTAGAHLGVVGALVTLLPATFYGEGIRRACLALRPESESWTGWRARLAIAPALLALAPLTWAALAVADRMVPLSPEGGGDGLGDRLVRIVAGFTVMWLVLSVLLTWVFHAVAPGRPRWWVAAAGGLATGSFLAGFLHGFQLFLAIPVDVGIPFGGLGVVGGVVAVGLWLYVLHVVLLGGWAVTQSLEERVAS